MIPKINIMLYSDSGVGKTTLLSTIVQSTRCDRAILIDQDKNGMSAQASAKLTIEVPQTLEESLAIVRRITRGKDKDKFNCVIFDTISDYSEGFFNDLAVAKAGKVGWAERNATAASTMQLIRLLKDSPMNVFIACHEGDLTKKIGEDDSEVIGKKPRLAGQIGSQTYGMMNAVWYYTWTPDRLKRCLVTRDLEFKGMLYKAKTAGKNFTKTVAQVIVEPNLPELFDKFYEAEYSNNPPSIETKDSINEQQPV